MAIGVYYNRKLENFTYRQIILDPTPHPPIIPRPSTNLLYQMIIVSYKQSEVYNSSFEHISASHHSLHRSKANVACQTHQIQLLRELPNLKSPAIKFDPDAMLELFKN